MLTARFKQVYKEGLVVKCADDCQRRFFPRFFVYSADYKEKYDLLCYCFRAHYFQGEACWDQAHWEIPQHSLLGREGQYRADGD